MQETFAQGLQQVMGVMAGAGLGTAPGFVPLGMTDMPTPPPPVQFDPAKLQQLQQTYLNDISA
ncbi:hypothetical protein, partial [Neisseria gonorrhoeae]|uniref:hypothetical protein n=1 Tax=Neisseria gonorrhoeae TaxID=485 RepID=UPI001E4D1238